MFKKRSFWTYSLALAIVWAPVLTVVTLVKDAGGSHQMLLVFGGSCIGWISTTIARYGYPVSTVSDPVTARLLLD